MPIEFADVAKDIAIDVAVPIMVNAGKEVVTRSVEKMAENNAKIESVLQEHFVVDGQRMTVLCSEKLQKYTYTLIPKSRGIKDILSKHIDLKGVTARESLYQVRGLTPVRAVKRTPDGIRIDLTNLIPGEYYTLELEYEFEEPRFIEALVDKVPPRDIPHVRDGVKHYELSAQLKDPRSLKKHFTSGVYLRDVDFTVDVSVHQDVNTTLPGVFIKQVDILRELEKPKGRAETYKLMYQKQHLEKAKFGGKTNKYLESLYEVFTPVNFENYIDVQKDFFYSQCSRGAELYEDVPFPTWPKTMKVTSKTDLNLDNPASDGILIYKHNEFLKEIEKIFYPNGKPKGKKKKRLDQL